MVTPPSVDALRGHCSTLSKIWIVAKSRYCTEIVQQICDRIALEGTDESGFRGLIGKETYYVWLRTRQDFSDAVKEAKAEYRRNRPEADRRQARKAFVSYLYGDMQKIISRREEGEIDGKPYWKETTTRVPVGTPKWAIERVLGKDAASEIEALVTLVEAGWIQREVLNLAIGELDRVKETLRQVFAGILPNGESARPGLTDETADLIRGKILGIEPTSIAALPATVDVGHQLDQDLREEQADRDIVG